MCVTFVGSFRKYFSDYHTSLLMKLPATPLISLQDVSPNLCFSRYIYDSSGYKKTLLHVIYISTETSSTLRTTGGDASINYNYFSDCVEGCLLEKEGGSDSTFIKGVFSLVKDEYFRNVLRVLTLPFFFVRIP